MTQKNVSAPSMAGATTNVVSSAEMVFAYIQLFPNTSTRTIEPYVSSIANRDEELNLIAAYVPVSQVESLAALSGVKSIKKVIPPVINIGSVTTEGDTVLRTANVRSQYGYSGSGIQTGVISDGVDFLVDAQNSGDLPPNVYVLSNAFGGSEGTAMLQIIYDMVPDTTLYFHDYSTNVIGFNNAIDQLQSNGCTVIVDDVTFLTEPYFEDGPIASHIADLTANTNLIYVTSAGNWARAHYQGDYYNDGSQFHDFSRGTSPDKNLYLTIPNGGTAQIVLQWNDKFGSATNNYDLYLLNAADNSVLTSSTSVQPGFVDPFEYIAYTNTGGSTINAKIAVHNVGGAAAPKTFGLLMYPQSYVVQTNIVPYGSISGQAAVPDVITVGAARWSTPTTIEPFSSRGPVTITFPSPVVRQKPDIIGVDGVSIFPAINFPSPFYGTSAAAPHIAAIAAQMWGGYPLYSPGHIRNALYSSAVDLGSPGRDTTFGNGRADALAMANFLNNTQYVGIFRNGVYYLRNSNSGGFADNVFIYGQTGDIPVVGDWTGTGKDTVGVYRNGTFFLRNSNSGGFADNVFVYGQTGDIPVVGDWTGTGKDTVGVYRNGVFYLRNSNTGGVADNTFIYGQAGDVPVVWHHDGRSSIGVYRDGVFYLRNTNTGGVADNTFIYGQAGDLSINGNWNGT